MQVWSEITISEEAESGKQVSSIIHVPSQASTYISSLLFALSQEIGRVGGHAMDRRIIEHLSGATLVGVVKAFESLLEGLESRTVEVPQPCALQLFYNLKYLASVLTPSKEAEVRMDIESRQTKSDEYRCMDCRQRVMRMYTCMDCRQRVMRMYTCRIWWEI
jgi:hypothetical protein